MGSIADKTNGCVYLYDSEDQLVKIISRNGHQFCGPIGVTFDKDHLYVTDISGVHKLTSDGDYLMKFDDRYGSDDHKMKYPKGLTVHNGKVCC